MRGLRASFNTKISSLKWGTYYSPIPKATGLAQQAGPSCAQPDPEGSALIDIRRVNMPLPLPDDSCKPNETTVEVRLLLAIVLIENILLDILLVQDVVDV